MEGEILDEMNVKLEKIFPRLDEQKEKQTIYPLKTHVYGKRTNTFTT